MITVFDDRAEALKHKIIGIFSIIAFLHLSVWGLAAFLFHQKISLMTVAFLAYLFGLKHGLDFDHIVAIDNVTRRLVTDNKRPLTAGFFFSLGHSTLVFVGTVVMVAMTRGFWQLNLQQWQNLGGLFCSLFSSLFLMMIAVANARNLIRHQPKKSALMAGWIRRSWQLYPLGLLFGLGFDTAAEIGILAIAAVNDLSSLSLVKILIFPALFTIGMILVDSSDSILMTGAYTWVMKNQKYRSYYNQLITSLSVLVAFSLGLYELIALFQSEEAGFFNHLAQYNFTLGLGLSGGLVLIWLLALAFQRLKTD